MVPVPINQNLRVSTLQLSKNGMKKFCVVLFYIFNTFKEEKVQLSDMEMVTFLQYVKEKFSDVLIPAKSIIKHDSLGEGTSRVCE